MSDNVVASPGSGGSTFRTFNDSGNIEWPASVICCITGGSAGAWTVSQADTNSGNKSAATLRVVLATDQPQLSNKLLVTPDLPSGASTAAKQPALGTAGSPSTDVITIQGATSMTPVEASLTPQTSGGLSIFSNISGASVEAHNVKNAPGQLYALEVFNNSTSPIWVRLYNETTTPGTGDTVFMRFMVPGATGGSGLAKSWDNGIAFGTGLGIRITAGAADNDNTALAANQVVYNVEYK